MAKGKDRKLLDAWVGGQVFLTYMGTDLPEGETLDSMVLGAMLAGSLEVHQGFAILERYDRLGVEIRHDQDPETGARLFLPWGAVLSIKGPTRPKP